MADPNDNFLKNFKRYDIKFYEVVEDGFGNSIKKLIDPEKDDITHLKEVLIVEYYEKN